MSSLFSLKGRSMGHGLNCSYIIKGRGFVVSLSRENENKTFQELYVCTCCRNEERRWLLLLVVVVVDEFLGFTRRALDWCLPQNKKREERSGHSAGHLFTSGGT